MARKGKLPDWEVEALGKLEKQFPKFSFDFRPHKTGQIEGRCPFCKEGEDRFVVFEEGNFWCRTCHQIGYWEQNRLSPVEIAAARLVKDQQRIKLKAQIATCNDWQQFYAQVSQGFQFWQEQGIEQADIDKWSLGFCLQAPCTNYQTASLTIPVFHKQRLVDIRHRLINPLDGQKYRSHWPNLPPAFFNRDAMQDGEYVFLVEGEKKAIVLEHYGLHPVVSYPGLNFGKALSHILAQEGSKSQRFVFLPDPGSENQLLSTWRELGKEYRIGVVDLVRKPDDFLRMYGVEALQNALVYPRWM